MTTIESRFADSLALRVADACRGDAFGESPESLLEALRAALPELPLRHAVTRGGWHRLGGVVDADYGRVADHVRTWAEDRHRAAGGDLEAVLDECATMRGFVTRLEGRTHYFTAPTGEAPEDFVQVEVEHLREVIARPLWDPDWLPDDLEGFIDPLDYPNLEPEPVGTPRLVFRRLVPVADFLRSEDAGKDLKRFFGDWRRSSAGDGARLCDHWCLGFREARDRSGEVHLGAKPIRLPCIQPAELPEQVSLRGAQLANLIHGFDRHCGYPFAWYFYMLTRSRVSHALAESVHADLMGAFDYLPARDLAVLRDWYDLPYSV